MSTCWSGETGTTNTSTPSCAASGAATDGLTAGTQRYYRAAGTNGNLRSFQPPSSQGRKRAMIPPVLPIETERLLLRTFERNDFDSVMAYHALPEVQRYLDWKARDRIEVKAALEAMRKEVALNRPGDTLSLAVEHRKDKRLIGQVSLRWHDATAAQAELRFVFNPAYRRQGYAGEAAKAAISLGFSEFGFHRIFARCDARNQQSARLLKG